MSLRRFSHVSFGPCLCVWNSFFVLRIWRNWSLDVFVTVLHLVMEESACYINFCLCSLIFSLCRSFLAPYLSASTSSSPLRYVCAALLMSTFYKIYIRLRKHFQTKGTWRYDFLIKEKNISPYHISLQGPDRAAILFSSRPVTSTCCFFLKLDKRIFLRSPSFSKSFIQHLS